MIVQLLIATAMAFGTADTLDAVRDVAPGPWAYMDALEGAEIIAVPPPVLLLGVSGKGETYLVAATEVKVDDGIAVPMGEELYLGETAYAGYIHNDGDTTLVVLDGDDEEIQIPPGGVLRTQCSNHCSVGQTVPCKSGTHACCWWDLSGCAHCNCVPDGKLPAPGIGCDSGGEGAGDCSMGDDAMEPRVPRSDDGKR